MSARFSTIDYIWPQLLMASRGQRGVSAIVLGSETLKVLTHSTIPVLVYRAARAGLSSLQ